MVGQGALENTFLEFDSKLIGGACFVTMKAKEAAEQKEQAKEPVAQPAVPQGSRWCLVEHIMKEGADSETTKGWWAGIAKMDGEAWTNMYKSNASKGLYNHWFLPMSKAEMYCLWELREGVSEATLQACLDNEVCPVAKNKLMFIDGKLNGGVYGFDSKFAAGQDPEALPASNEVGEHRLYLVKHDVKPEKKEEWWKAVGGFFTDADLQKKYADYQAENCIVGHAMYPITEDCIYCLWEAKTALNKQAIEDVLGPNGMVGQGALENTFLEFDSKLTGGACFVTMKAKEAALQDKEVANTKLGTFFTAWLTGFCQKPEVESELEVVTKDA
jgi:hypothetical protein